MHIDVAAADNPHAALKSGCSGIRGGPAAVGRRGLSSACPCRPSDERLRRATAASVAADAFEMIVSDPVFLLDQRHGEPDIGGDRVIVRGFQRGARLLQQRINS